MIKRMLGASLQWLEKLIAARHSCASCLLLILSMLPFLLVFWGMQHHALRHADAGLFYRQGLLAPTQMLTSLVIVLLGGIAAYCWRHYHSQTVLRPLEYLTTVTLFFICTLLAIAYGLKDTPLGIVLLGLLLMARAFFSFAALAPALLLCAGMVLAGEVLTGRGLLPYAPLLSHPVYTGQALGWWWDIWMRVLTNMAELYFAVTMFFLFGVLERQYRQLDLLVRTDALTGLLNRRAFMQCLETECAKHARTGRHVCVLMCDLDLFKKVNDTWGHPAGDQVLSHFGQLLRACTRSDIDVAARFGGEEFVLLLPETDLQSAQHVAARIAQQLREHRFEVGGGQFQVTTSMGVAEIVAGDSRKALRIADENLYHAKHSGRDRIVASMAA